MASRALIGALAVAAGACAGSLPSYRKPGALPEPSLREPPALRVAAGSSSRGRRHDLSAAWPPGARLRFASSAAGFGVLEAWDGGWALRLVDARGRSLHCCEALGRQRCRPVACRGDP